MSCSCTHIDTWNPCRCGYTRVTTTSTTTTTICPNGEPCEEAIDPRCIIYNGPDLDCYGIKTGDSAADILQIIIDNFACLTTTTSTTSTTTTTTAAPTTTTTSTTSTTSSTTTSTTTTTTTAAPQSEFGVDNQLPSGAEIDDVTFDLISVPLDIPYPVTPGLGGAGVKDNGTYTLEVFFIGVAGGETITVQDSTGAITCITLTPGQISQTFIGQVLDDTLSFVFSIVLSPVPC
jgi:hypothetical protein